MGAKVSTFLDSVGRNSSSTKAVYKIGLRHFERFLSAKGYTPETMLAVLQAQKINVYELLDSFVSYLHPAIHSPRSLRLYITAVKSYLQYYDIDIVPHKYKHRVKLPREYREDEQPIDAEDIRNLLQKCHSRRLKAFLLILASSGLRAGEACSLRLRDIDFNSEPTKVHVRKEYNKTKTARDVYISDEATQELKDLIKLNSKKKPLLQENLIFGRYKVATPQSIYNRMASAFRDLLEVVRMDDKKDNSGRHKITLHSFRRAVFSIVTDQAGSQYADWLLGHDYSVYWTKKEPERRRVYAEQCMKHLTYLDYSLLTTHGRSMELKIEEQAKEISNINQKFEQLSQMFKDHAGSLEEYDKIHDEIEGIKPKKK